MAGHEYQATWDHCTVSIADCLSEFGEVPANRARMERMKATIVRTSMLVSSAIDEVKGRVMCIVSDEVIRSRCAVEML